MAKSKSSCSLPHLLLTCHSAFPRAVRPVTFNQLPVPTGGARFRVQHSPPGSAQEHSVTPLVPGRFPQQQRASRGSEPLRARPCGCQHIGLLDTSLWSMTSLHSHWIARGRESSSHLPGVTGQVPVRNSNQVRGHPLPSSSS